ncbi:choice-of-anchor B family protein [Rubrivirga marina]|uniref:Secretion system C-terminal sorting domain-containing protein n=1 Tax=Rubrivirga marina TaxID=1196024 RepID=A0A271J4F0_9BACT|nr:choice-of-anchor B family protein [Rubrivirga marina]PAP78401.1 hypothetical protein BSZ37_19220 [Rubrivirga marina]
MRACLASLLVLTAGLAPATAQPVLAPGPADLVPEAARLGDDAPGLTWVWSPEPRWLDPADANRRYFDGGLDYGANFVFSTVPDAEVPPVTIVFDPATPSTARVFSYRHGLADAGIGRFDGAAYDVSDPENPRRLNVGFLEDSQTSQQDRTWNPDGSPFGAHEYLIVFASDYDPKAETYAGETAYDLDTYYGLAARVRDGHALFETVAEMRFTPAPLRDVAAAAVANGVADAVWTAATYTGGTDVRAVVDGTVLATADPSSGRVRVTGLDPDRTVDLAIQLHGPDGLIAERSIPIQARVSEGVAAFSALDPGRARSSTYGDTWGYVAADGTEYALLAVRDGGLSVIDVSAAPGAAPVEVAYVPAPPQATDTKDVKVYGHHAYVVNETGPIQIVDLSDPTAPVEVGRLDVQPGVTDGGSHNVLVAEDHLWVIGGRFQGNPGLRVYALTDPASPALVDAFRPDHWPTPYYHDFEVRDGRGYGSAIYSGGGVDVLDVSDPTDVRLLTSFSYPGAGVHNTCSTENGRTLYVGDEIGTSGNWIRIFDVADLDDVELVGEVVVDPNAVVHNCYVRGDRLYVAHYTEGLRVFDVSDPHAPTEVAYLDTFLEPGYGFRGAWTAYPYLPSGKVLVSDMQTGLWVVALEDAAVAAEPASAGPTALRVWPNPTTGAATLAYDLFAPAEADVVVLDVLGREVARVRETGRAGTNRLSLGLGDAPAGVYAVRLTVAGRVRGTTTLTVAR